MLTSVHIRVLFTDAAYTTALVYLCGQYQQDGRCVPARTAIAIYRRTWLTPIPEDVITDIGLAAGLGCMDRANYEYTQHKSRL
jgi:hypothetical protein